MKHESTKKEEHYNRMLIHLIQYNPLLFFNNQKVVDLLESGSFEEKEQYINYIKKFNFLVIVCVLVLTLASFFSYSYFTKETPKPESIQPIFSEAGTIKSIKVHHTAFSRDSTIETDQGVIPVFFFL